MKKLAFYCSGGASRVLSFYAKASNLERFPPALVIYDGGRGEIESALRELFAEGLKTISEADIAKSEIKGLHSATSSIIHQLLDEAEIDLLLCFGDKILKKELVNAYSGRAVNFHPSLLPAFKGLGAIDQATQTGALVIGNTAHFMNEGVDTGKIILQTAMRTADMSSYNDVLDLQLPMIKLVLRDLLGVKLNEGELDSDIAEMGFPVIMPEKCSV